MKKVLIGLILVMAALVPLQSDAACTAYATWTTDQPPRMLGDPFGYIATGNCAYMKFYIFSIGGTVPSQVSGQGGVAPNLWGPQNTTCGDAVTANNVFSSNATFTGMRFGLTGWSGVGGIMAGCPCANNGAVFASDCAGFTVGYMVTSENAPATEPFRYVYIQARNAGTTFQYDGAAEMYLYNAAGSTVGACVAAGCQLNGQNGTTSPFSQTALATAINAGWTTPQIAQVSGGAGTAITLQWAPLVTVGPASGSGGQYGVLNYEILYFDEADAGNPTVFNGNYTASNWTSVGTLSATDASCAGGICSYTIPAGVPAAGMERYFALRPTFRADVSNITPTKVGFASAAVTPTAAGDGEFVNTTASYVNIQAVNVAFSTTDETNVAAFNVYRGAGENPSTWAKLTAVPSPKGTASSYSFTDNTLPRQRTFGLYTYRVNAIDATGATLFTIDVQVQK